MNLIHSKEYNEKELVRELLGNDFISGTIDEIEDYGLETDIEISSIHDSTEFIKSYIENMYLDIIESKNTRKTPTVIVDDMQHKPTGGIGGNREAGHPDFKVTVMPRYGDEEEIFVELKNNNDSLRKSQIEWVLEAMEKEEDVNVWVMWVEQG